MRRTMPDEIFDKEEFLLSFRYKFDNVLRKAPIKALFKIIEPIVYVSVMNYEHDIEFTIDYRLPVKKNIFNIRKMLYDMTFPILHIIEETREQITAEESEKLINEGMAIEKALSMTKQVVTNDQIYKIDKVIIDRDEIFINDMNSDWRGHYKLTNILISIFLKRLREWWTPEEGGKVFKENAQFIKRIYPEHVYDQMKNTREIT